MKKKVCLITPGHIASNPRLVKEAQALDQKGYKVHLIFTQYVNYLVPEDSKILAAHTNWSYSVLNWTNQSISSKFVRFKTGLFQKILLRLQKYTFNKEFVKHLLNRNYNWQLKEAVRAKANLYIAHNLGALPVAKQAARLTNSLCGFDAEDFHRNELSNDANSPDVILKATAEERYMQGLSYITAASPMIAREYEKLLKGPKIVPILNVFPLASNISVQSSDGTALRLFWFSQRIGKGRGLEEVIKALGILKKTDIQLHLLGEIRGSDKSYFEDLAKANEVPEGTLYYYTPISSDHIISFAASFDVGLATETGFPYNRDICLTNKIFTYIQAGLATIASNTSAQEDIMKKYPDIGALYPREDVKKLAEVIESYYFNRELLVGNKQKAYSYGQSILNWDEEQKKIIHIIESLIN